MWLTDVVQIAGRQSWLDPVGDLLQGTVSAAYAAVGSSARGVQNFLHGTWLGHPLHPVLPTSPSARGRAPRRWMHWR